MNPVKAASRIALAACFVSAPLAPSPRAQQDGGGMEEFTLVDPYTEGDPERMKRLGYESFGPFPWLGGDSTAEVREKMGAIPMLWVETAHFRIGSTLSTYELPGDREERERLADELDRLRAKLGKLKASKREIDPWLRLHLVAQRMEELYASFVEDFELEPSDYSELGPYLGQTEKFRLLLCERKSEYARHSTLYLKGPTDSSYRFGWSATGMGYAACDELLRERWPSPAGVPFDTLLFCSVASSFGHVFLDAYRRNDYGAPEWLRRGYGHVLSRRFDPRHPHDAGYEEGQTVDDDDWKWEPRVAGLARNAFYPKTSELFAWTSSETRNKRDNLVAWSRVEFLLSELEGDRAAFLRAVCQPEPKGTPEAARDARIARQRDALHAVFDLSPEELDAAWAEWVQKTYARK